MMAGAPPMHLCMDSDWLKGIVPEDPAGMGGSSSPSAELIAACPRPTMHQHHATAAAVPDRRLRPQHDQPLKCPRCESTHTKFCYYNNYSLSQPRYFCKTCRRYWTKGGSLRNVPVGGGCRKNKRSSAKSKGPTAPPPPLTMHHQPRHIMAAETGLHLSFSGMMPQLPPPPPAADPLCSLGLLDWKYDPMLAAGPGSGGGSLDGAASEAHFAAGTTGMMGIPGGGGECHHALSALRYAAGLGEHHHQQLLQLQGLLPFGARGEQQQHEGATMTMEVKPAAAAAATERLLSLDSWYSETSSRVAPAESGAIGSLGALGLWSGMLGVGGAHQHQHQHHGSSAAI